MWAPPTSPSSATRPNSSASPTRACAKATSTTSPSRARVPTTRRGRETEMTIDFVLLPVFVEVGLTFFLLFWTGRTRVAAVRSREVLIPDVALGQPGWPARVTLIANAYHNQLQLPVLFYVLVI